MASTVEYVADFVPSVAGFPAFEKTARTKLSCMLASGRNGPLSVLGGLETRQLTLGAGRLLGRTAEDGQAGQGNAGQPAGDLVVHKQVRGPKAPASNQAVATSSISMKPPSRPGRAERIAEHQP